MSETLKIDTEKVNNPEIVEIVQEVSNLLRNHADTLKNDIDNFGRKESGFVSWLSENIGRRPFADMPDDPTVNDTESVWYDTKRVVENKLQPVKKTDQKSRSDYILSEYYTRVVPKIESIVNSNDRREDEETVNKLMIDYDELQRILDGSFSKRSLNRSGVIIALKGKSQEISAKASRLYNSYFDNRRVMDMWNSTAAAIYSRRFRGVEEEAEGRNRYLDNEQRNISNNDSFVVSRNKMADFLVALIKIKYEEKD